MDVAIVVGIAFVGFLYSCLRGWKRFKDPVESQRPRVTGIGHTPDDHHARPL